MLKYVEMNFEQLYCKLLLGFGELGALVRTPSGGENQALHQRLLEAC